MNMFRTIKTYIKSIVPNQLWEMLHNVRFYISQIIPLRCAYHQKLGEIRGKKGPVNVLFFVIIDNQWKYDSLFKLMKDNTNFNPLIVVCPIVTRSHEYMIEKMNQCCQYFKDKNYPYICGYDDSSDSSVDLMQYKPDIIFYSCPDKSIAPYFKQHNFKHSLLCYVDYFYVTTNEKWACALDFHKKLWRYYMEYPLLKEQTNEFYKPCAVNGKVVGYPLFDTFRQYQVSDKDWPIVGKRKKRIIWAPHHTISCNTATYAMSTFEKYYEFMQTMAEKYKNDIQIVFKPHPVLKPSLYDTNSWGHERTDAYYEKWAKGENTAFVDGEYIGLFLASDAMIHDCNSFTVEYLAVNKPAMFLDSGMTDDKINEAGKEARACYYKGYCEKDIENFIKMIIEGGEDKLKDKREAFYKNYILPPNGKLAAENIIDDLLASLDRK